MFNPKDEVDLLCSARHDFLNDLQLIKGYLFLKKPDKAEEIIGRVTQKLNQQSRLSHLHLPNCSVYLMQYGWSSSHAFRLTYEVLGHEDNLAQYDDDLTEMFQQLFAFLEESSSPVGNNSVRIVLDTEEKLRILLIFEGKLQEKEKASQQLSKVPVNQSFQWVEHYMINTDSDGSVRWTMCLSIK
ncbi:Spo0B domain-containing protein [Sporolactobacillus kofuensis]|uniref:Spo0B domain-containing protein n=1 Tax=Sporolactobacillus kofuensis TaxID=269672 RepID=A0ABW1WA24_9BACL|nr:Spo0B domain-containing protein [Sporolactobacillus kofuensis]MCO7175591.1 sporulation initiation phosphotransferase B [Sporolactobacillus kofuensis]